MPVFLRVKDGNSLRDVAVLASAETLTIGRDRDADLSFPFDIRMSSLHAQVTLHGQVCTALDLDSTNGMFLDEQPVVTCILGPGDVLRCGNTEFCVEITDSDQTAEMAVHPAASHHDNGPAVSVALETNVPGGGQQVTPLPQEFQQMKGFCAKLAMDIYRRFALEKMLSTPPDPTESTEAYTIRLLESGAVNDCLYFLGYALPKRLGVWWLMNCIRTADCPKCESDPAMLEAIEEWLKSPTDETRRAAMKLAEKLDLGTPPALAGLAVFFSHGSLGPVDTPEIPAPDNTAGKAIGGGAILATVIHLPEKAPERRRRFVDLALKISSGELSWQQDK